MAQMNGHAETRMRRGDGSSCGGDRHGRVLPRAARGRQADRLPLPGVTSPIDLPVSVDDQRTARRAPTMAAAKRGDLVGRLDRAAIVRWPR